MCLKQRFNFLKKLKCCIISPTAQPPHWTQVEVKNITPITFKSGESAIQSTLGLPKMVIGCLMMVFTITTSTRAIATFNMGRIEDMIPNIASTLGCTIQLKVTKEKHIWVILLIQTNGGSVNMLH
ncbi:hypothetical protein OV760_25635 [Salmonella enterica subsp. enterica serovar 1,4,[5],12:i:-]|nr:hypothetical protein [Salmonella enterica subsp. enterica serovar 1,4,[5],12:i:-]